MTRMTRTVTVPAEVSTTERTSLGQLTSTLVKLPDKDPDEEVDYILDWTARLDSGDYIADSDFIYVADVGDNKLRVTFGQFTQTTVTLWLRGGREGVTYSLTNRVTTYLERVMDQTVSVKIVSR